MNDTSVSGPIDADDQASRRTIIWLTLGVVLLCCCVAVAAALFWFKPDPQALIAEYFPTSTTTPSPTPSQTPTPRATATSTSTPTPNLTATAEILQMTNTALAFEGTATNAAGTWRAVMTDAFDSNKNKWLNEPSDDEFAKVDYQVADGKYHWDVTTHKSFIGWVRAGTKTFSDFYVSVDAQQISGPDSADFGIVFREDKDGNFYYFGTNNHGQYVLYVYSGEWNTLIDWTDTNLLKTDEPNRITVIAQGSQFTFLINDHYLTSISDEHIAKGFIALAVEMSQENDEGSFEFDNFELRTPK